MVMINARPTSGHKSSQDAIDAIEVLLARRSHGSLDAITDSERRGLRPIGATAREVADRTGLLLAELLALPGVLIFHGVRHPAAHLPLISHAVNAGRSLVLVESVTWPPGRYAVTASGQVHCDGVYIGQSASPLMAAVRHWRAALPRDHRVRAIVVVYHAAPGTMSLPGRSPRGPVWATADDALGRIRAHLPAGRPALSSRAVMALVAATIGEQGGHEPGADQDPVAADDSLTGQD